MCGDAAQVKTITSTDLAGKQGVLVLKDWLPSGVTELVIRPEFIGTDGAKLANIIQEIRLELSSLRNNLDFDVGGKTNSVPREDRLTLFG